MGVLSNNAPITVTATAVANAAEIASLKADDTAQDALIALNATKAEVALIKADNDAQDPFTSFVRQADNSIDWTKESGATGTIASPNAATGQSVTQVEKDAWNAKADQTALAQEVTDRTAADALKEDLANKLTAVRLDGSATDAGYTSEKAVADAIATLSAMFTGGVVTPSSATFAGLAAIPADASATKVYWTVLTADDGVNVAGIYISNGGAWSLYMAVRDPLPVGGDPISYKQLAAGNAVAADTAIAIDYSADSEQFLESRLVCTGTNTITFDPASFGAGTFNKIRRHRVWINSNTGTTTIKFAANGWRLEGDASVTPPDITIQPDKNITLEFNYTPEGGIGYVRQIGSAEKATATYQGLQKVATWVNPNSATQIPTSLTAYTTSGLDFSTADRVRVNFIDSTTTKSYPHEWDPQITQQSWFWGYAGDTSHAEIVIDNLNGDIVRFRRGGSRSLYVHSIETWAEAANGFVIPTGTTLATEINVTVNGGAVNINSAASASMLEGIGAYSFFIDLPAGQILDTITASGGSVSIRDARFGLVSVQAPAGTGDIALTATFRANVARVERFANLACWTSRDVAGQFPMIDPDTGLKFKEVTYIAGDRRRENFGQTDRIATFTDTLVDIEAGAWNGSMFRRIKSTETTSGPDAATFTFYRDYMYIPGTDNTDIAIRFQDSHAGSTNVFGAVFRARVTYE